MKRSIALISTGGTIEKTYDELRGVLSNQVSVLDIEPSPEREPEDLLPVHAEQLGGFRQGNPFVGLSRVPDRRVLARCRHSVFLLCCLRQPCRILYSKSTLELHILSSHGPPWVQLR